MRSTTDSRSSSDRANAPSVRFEEKLMRELSILALFLASGTAAPAGVDLSTIDRTVAREPAYRAQPRYCLLVFGPEARTRVWLVRDGEVLYVDRNGNGDLTKKGERHTGTRGHGLVRWQIGDIVEAD